MRRSPVLLALLAGIWGTAFFLVKIGLQDLGPVTIVASRMVVGALALGGAMAVVRPPRGGPGGLRPVSMFLGAVLSVAAPNLLIAWGSQHMASGSVAILVATAPMFALVLGTATRHQGDAAFTVVRSAGIVVGFGGAVVLVATGGKVDGVNDTQVLLAHGAILLAAALAGVGGLYNRRTFAGHAALRVSATQVTVSALLLAPAAVAWDRPDALPGWEATGAVIGLGIGASAIGYGIYYELLRTVGAARALAVNYLVIAVAVLAGATFLSEPLSVGTGAGLALVVGGLFLTNRPAAVVRPRVP